ncbi:MAG: isoprenylcysteine carboxylmethyltransferase family protein [bacterium]
MTVIQWGLAGLFGLAAWQRFRVEGREHHGARRGVVRDAWTGYAMVTLHVLTYMLTAIETSIRWARHAMDPRMAGMGLSLFLAGFLLRRWAIRTLGPYWSLQIEIRPDQPVMCGGPYRWMRHPNYLALMLEVVGLPLAGQAFWTILPVLRGYYPLILLRLFCEERALLASVPQYRHYQQGSGTFWPGPAWLRTRRQRDSRKF